MAIILSSSAACWDRVHKIKKTGLPDAVEGLAKDSHSQETAD